MRTGGRLNKTHGNMTRTRDSRIGLLKNFVSTIFPNLYYKFLVAIVFWEDTTPSFEQDPHQREGPGKAVQLVVQPILRY
jgi:hypothetical protein